MESDQLKLLARSFQPADAVVADAGASGLRIFVESAAAIPSVANVLGGAETAVKRVARGPIHFCLMDQVLPGEVEITAGRDFPVTPQIRGAIKSLAGVVTVEDI